MLFTIFFEALCKGLDNFSFREKIEQNSKVPITKIKVLDLVRTETSSYQSHVLVDAKLKCKELKYVQNISISICILNSMLTYSCWKGLSFLSKLYSP